MHEPGGVNGGERTADVLPHAHRLARIQAVPSAHRDLERLAANELHAQADVIVVRLDAVHADNVRVTHLRQGAGLEQQPRLELVVRDVAMENLDGDFALELWVPGAIDAAERSRSHPLQQPVPAPRFADVVRQRVIRVHADRSIERLRLFSRSMHVGNGADEPQIVQSLDRFRALHVSGHSGPVDGSALGDVFGRARDGIVTRNVAFVRNTRHEAPA